MSSLWLSDLFSIYVFDFLVELDILVESAKLAKTNGRRKKKIRKSQLSHLAHVHAR